MPYERCSTVFAHRFGLFLLHLLPGPKMPLATKLNPDRASDALTDDPFGTQSHWSAVQIASRKDSRFCFLHIDSDPGIIRGKYIYLEHRIWAAVNIQNFTSREVETAFAPTAAAHALVQPNLAMMVACPWLDSKLCGLMPTWGHGMSGAPERALAKARSRSFPFQFKPNGNQYLSLTGGPGVYIAFFGTGFAAVLSPILCTVRFYVLRPVHCTCLRSTLCRGWFSLSHIICARLFG